MTDVTERTDPTVVTLDDFPDEHRDPHWVAENLTAQQRRLLEHMPAEFADATPDHPAVQAWVRDLVELAAGAQRTVPQLVGGRSLLLLGGTGRGKTYLAWGAIRALAYSGLRVGWLFTTTADLFGDLRPRPNSDPERTYRAYADAPLLVLDDAGADKGSEWTEQVLGRLIDHRYRHHLPVLITSNLPPQTLARELGERVHSRLVQMCEVVRLKGPDRRLPADRHTA